MIKGPGVMVVFCRHSNLDMNLDCATVKKSGSEDASDNLGLFEMLLLDFFLPVAGV